jgi:hypothetical protein
VRLAPFGHITTRQFAAPRLHRQLELDEQLRRPSPPLARDEVVEDVASIFATCSSQ